MNGYSHNPISSLRQIVSGFKALKNFHLSDLRKVFSLMGKNEKIALLALTLAALISLLVSAKNFYISNTKIVPAFGGQLTEGLLGQPQYINPLLAISDTDQSLTRLIFSGLYKYGPNGELIPDLAENLPEISDDQKNYIITLKKNAVWHNNTPVTVEDIIFTVETLKNPEFKSPLRGFWLNTRVEKISDNQIKFINKDISGPFIFNLTLPILPKNIWQKVDASGFLLNKTNLEAVGSGPYAISQIKKLPNGKIESITLKSFNDFYKSRPNIETFNIKFYDSAEDIINGLRGKEIDLAGSLPAAGEDLSDISSNYKLIKLPLPQYQTAFFNLNEGLTSQEFIRKSLNLATNKQAIIDEVYLSERQLPLDPLTKQVISDTANMPEAAKILDQAGWTLGQENIRQKKDQKLGLTITASDSVSAKETAQNLKSQWEKLGLEINVDIKPSKQLMDETLRPRKFQVLIYSQKFGADPDPFFFWHSSQSKDPGLNLTGLSDGNLDKLLTDARNTTNQEARLAKYSELGKVISGKYAVILLNQNQYFYFINSKVQNIKLTSLNDTSSRFYDLPNWYINTKRVWK